MTIGQHEIIAIAAALGDTYGIGYQQDLPWSIPGDWEWFQRITTKPYTSDTNLERYSFEKDSDWHNIVIMGRLSWESIPMQQRPHHNRYNIVVSSQASYNVHAVEKWEHATLVNSIQDALALATQLKKNHGRIFILGGEQIYRQVIGQDTPHCTHILLTHIHHTPSPSPSPPTRLQLGAKDDETVDDSLCNNNNKIECDTFFPSIRSGALSYSVPPRTSTFRSRISTFRPTNTRSISVRIQAICAA